MIHNARLLRPLAAVALAALAPVNAQTNTATGIKAGAKVTTGKHNTADGFNALQNNNTGSFNTAVGSKALKKTIGSNNVAIGFESLLNNKGGDFNVAIGDGAMKFGAEGNNNVALGMDAGALTTGSDNILIDHKGVQGESGTIRIGTPGTHESTFIAGKITGDGSGLTGISANAISGTLSGGKIAVGSITYSQLAPDFSFPNFLHAGSVGSFVLGPNGSGGVARFGPTNGKYLAVDGDDLMAYNNNVPSTLHLGQHGGTVAIASGATSGNVGIGTSSPTAKLDVRGDIKLGTSAQFFAVGSQEKLRTIRGKTIFNGTRVNGGGFTCSQTATGKYTITFDQPFILEPSVQITVINNPGEVRFASTHSLSNSSCGVEIFDHTGTPRNAAMSVTITGER